MAKKKQKSSVVNAIDKYLMQKRYSRVTRGKVKSPSSTPKAAQSKNSSLNPTIKRTRSQASQDNISLPNVRALRSLKSSNKADLKTEPKKSSKRVTHDRATISTKSTKPSAKDSKAQVAVKKSTSEKIQPKSRGKRVQSTKKPEAVPPVRMSTRKRKFEKESFPDFEKRQRVEFKIVKKPSKAVKNAQSSEPSRKAAKNIRKRKGEAMLSKNHLKRKSKTGVTTVQPKTTENAEVERETVAKVTVAAKADERVRRKRPKTTENAEVEPETVAQVTVAAKADERVRRKRTKTTENAEVEPETVAKVTVAAKADERVRRKRTKTTENAEVEPETVAKVTVAAKADEHVRRKRTKTTENAEVEPETAKVTVAVKADKHVRRKRTKDTTLPNKKPVQSDSQSTSLKSHECRDHSSSSDESSHESENTGEVNPVMKKYQPYMKRIKSLNSEEIAKFIKDNQQYYVDFKNGIESKDKRRPKKQKDEMKSIFKCNPFNSEQQIAMYVTLREVFNIPQTHFKECRNFFISLLPEISCQLFAEVFRIRATFAPRLIKRLYPKPVCPV